MDSSSESARTCSEIALSVGDSGEKFCDVLNIFTK